MDERCSNVRMVRWTCDTSLSPELRDRLVIVSFSGVLKRNKL